MRNSYLRPLNFNYVDTYEKTYQTDDVPIKFRLEADNYQKRVAKPPTVHHSHSLEMEEIISNFQQPPSAQQSPKLFPEVHKVNSMTFEPLLMNRLPSPLSDEMACDHPHKHTYPEPVPAKKSNSIFTCCSQQELKNQVCLACMRALCNNCLNQPQTIKQCTKCLQKMCRQCKTAMGLTFPDYKLRNYPINFKKLSELHFSGCTCTTCSTVHN